MWPLFSLGQFFDQETRIFSRQAQWSYFKCGTRLSNIGVFSNCGWPLLPFSMNDVWSVCVDKKFIGKRTTCRFTEWNRTPKFKFLYLPVGLECCSYPANLSADNYFVSWDLCCLFVLLECCGRENDLPHAPVHIDISPMHCGIPFGIYLWKQNEFFFKFNSSIGQIMAIKTWVDFRVHYLFGLVFRISKTFTTVNGVTLSMWVGILSVCRHFLFTAGNFRSISSLTYSAPHYIS